MTWIAVGLGGALGAMARYGLNSWVLRTTPLSGFPAGIFLINVIGSGTIGVIAGLMTSGRVHLSDEARAFVMVGMLGGFTTFSSFSLDSLELLRTGHPTAAVLNVVGQVGLSLAAAAIGYRLAS